MGLEVGGDGVGGKNIGLGREVGGGAPLLIILAPFFRRSPPLFLACFFFERSERPFPPAWGIDPLDPTICGWVS